MDFKARKILTGIIVFFFIHIKGWSQDTTVLTLQEIIRTAEKSFPTLLQYQSRAKAKDELSKGAKSWMPPTLSLGMDRFPYKPETAMEEEGSDMGFPSQRSIMISAQQMIPNPSRQKAKQAYQRSLSAVESSNYEWARQQLIKEIKLLYYQRYISEMKLSVLKELQQLLELVTTTSEAAYTYNKASLSTIFKAKAKQEELSNMRIMFEAQIAESNLGLNTFMQKPSTHKFEIDTSFVDVFPELNEASLASAKQRSDLETMERTIKTMELNRSLMRSGLKPDFGLNVTHMQMFEMPPVWSVMGMITLPIVPWSARMSKSEVSSMEYEIEAMKQQKSGMELMNNRMASEKLIMLESERKQLANYKNNIVPAYHKNFESALTAYKQTTSDYFILLDAWEMLLMKKMELIDKKGEVLNLGVEYEFESGQLR